MGKFIEVDGNATSQSDKGKVLILKEEIAMIKETKHGSAITLKSGVVISIDSTYEELKKLILGAPEGK